MRRLEVAQPMRAIDGATVVWVVEDWFQMNRLPKTAPLVSAAISYIYEEAKVVELRNMGFSAAVLCVTLTLRWQLNWNAYFIFCVLCIVV